MITQILLYRKFAKAGWISAAKYAKHINKPVKYVRTNGLKLKGIKLSGRWLFPPISIPFLIVGSFEQLPNSAIEGTIALTRSDYWFKKTSVGWISYLPHENEIAKMRRMICNGSIKNSVSKLHID